MIGWLIFGISIVFEALLLYIYKIGKVDLTYNELLFSCIVTILVCAGIVIYKLFKMIATYEDE